MRYNFVLAGCQAFAAVDSLRSGMCKLEQERPLVAKYLCHYMGSPSVATRLNSHAQRQHLFLQVFQHVDVLLTYVTEYPEFSVVPCSNESRQLPSKWTKTFAYTVPDPSPTPQIPLDHCAGLAPCGPNLDQDKR
jgi:Asp-tRNA(Asn)/Glu-tRNA(Gln) amidotransferase A subunit family amidase